MNNNPLRLTAITILLSLLIPLQAQDAGQDYDNLWFYRVWFTGKTAGVSDYSPGDLLSDAAIARRQKFGIPVLTESDIPVSPQHINALTQAGLSLRCTSKWLNTGLFSSPVQLSIAELEGSGFIRMVQLVKHPADPVKKSYSKYGTTLAPSDPVAFDPRIPLNGHILHQSGMTGQNVIIAVLDAGFNNADVIESLEPLRTRGGIIAEHDFVYMDNYVYDYHTHGTSVLSILAGALPGIIYGTAPGADYILLRTEDDNSEFPVEEDYWVAGAEYADSAGADIISSSLGYFTFDDPVLSHSFSDMDGSTTFVSRGADIAASKGILVVNSAGNERNKSWVRIIAPSDGDSVLCIGAVKHDLTISDFSSAGYSSDGQVKPDVVAPGVSLPLQYEPLVWYNGSGTSFSCPVISGLCASLMQAVPQASPTEIIGALHESSDRYTQPDSLYGYGLPDFLKALRLLEEKRSFIPEINITAGPNPFTDEIYFWFREAPGSLSVTVTTGDGSVIIRKQYPVYAAREFRLEGLGILAQGIYIISVMTEQGDRTLKMIRVNR
jgi:hypothetical protein